MPADFAPNEQHRAYAATNRLDLDAEFAHFTDHHRARASTFADWSAALRTWLRNAVKFRRGGGNSNNGPTGADAGRALVARLEERDRQRGGER